MGDKKQINHTRAPSCNICGHATPGRRVSCTECKESIHVTCLGLGRNAYPSGTFMCASCVQKDACLPDSVPESVSDDAHRLVWLRGMRVRESSQNTYASSLHRYIKYWQNGGSKTIDQILPHTGIRKGDVHLFLAHASAQYKYNTIASVAPAVVGSCMRGDKLHGRGYGH
jgi:PHD-finger